MDNVRETKREIKKKPQGGGMFYELTVVQEYHEDNVKNMVESWEQQNNHCEKWLKDNLQKKDDVINQTLRELEIVRDNLKKDFEVTPEQVLDMWRKELIKKREWIDHFDEHLKDAEKKAIEQIDALTNTVRKQFETNEKSITLWKNALHNQ